VKKNDTINNDMITEDTIRDISSRAIAQTLESHRINTKQATINDCINGNVRSQPQNQCILLHKSIITVVVGAENLVCPMNKSNQKR
jgi:hypothetical protein